MDFERIHDQTTCGMPIVLGYSQRRHMHVLGYSQRTVTQLVESIRLLLLEKPLAHACA